MTMYWWEMSLTQWLVGLLGVDRGVTYKEEHHLVVLRCANQTQQSKQKEENTAGHQTSD